MGGIVMLFFSGCQKTNILKKNKTIIRSAVEQIWNQGHLDIADELFATDYIYHGIPEIRGAEGTKQHVADLRASFPDFHLSLEDMIAEGDKVVSRWTGDGTQVGEFMGIPASGKKVKITGIIISRIANDKIIEEWETSDQLGMLQLLGVIPPMPDASISALKRIQPGEFLWSEISKVTGDPGNTEKNKAIIQHEEDEVWNQRNLNTFETLFSPAFINHDPALPDIRNFKDFKQFWTMVGGITKDYHLTIDDIIAERDKVAVRWSSHFVDTATKKLVTNKGIVIYRLADGKILESWFCTDMLGFMRQIDVLPSSAK